MRNTSVAARATPDSGASCGADSADSADAAMVAMTTVKLNTASFSARFVTVPSSKRITSWSRPLSSAAMPAASASPNSMNTSMMDSTSIANMWEGTPSASSLDAMLVALKKRWRIPALIAAGWIVPAPPPDVRRASTTEVGVKPRSARLSPTAAMTAATPHAVTPLAAALVPANAALERSVAAWCARRSVRVYATALTPRPEMATPPTEKSSSSGSSSGRRAWSSRRFFSPM
mmetsp:Transcript_27249/g.66909  ORF Transcript_27249/g.66909 Transcript_27249/m.66909 type:complete len:232 (-) Transcript_27249:109-804(-)